MNSNMLNTRRLLTAAAGIELKEGCFFFGLNRMKHALLSRMILQIYNFFSYSESNPIFFLYSHLSQCIHSQSLRVCIGIEEVNFALVTKIRASWNTSTKNAIKVGCDRGANFAISFNLREVTCFYISHQYFL